MQPRSDLIRSFTRRLSGVASLAAVAAAAGDPVPLLELQRTQAALARRPRASGTPRTRLQRAARRRSNELCVVRRTRRPGLGRGRHTDR
jgi:hypothetical protein